MTPLYNRIITISLSAVLMLAFISGIYILIKRNDESLYITKDKPNIMAQPVKIDDPTTNILDPNSEIRGIWIATVNNIDFPSKTGLGADELRAEIDDIINNVKEYNLNAIYFQVRPTADALYDSSIFPLSTYFVKTQNSSFPGGFDPLEYITQKAHENNILLYAWVNPLRVTYGTADNPSHDTKALGSSNPARKHPEWTVPYADGKLYFNAGIPAVRSLIADGVAEIVSRYPVDGVIFDDYFYPYQVKNAVFDDASSYKTYGKNFSDINDWRRDNVNKMVELCYKSIKNIRTDCKFGIAPFGIWQNDDGKNGGSETKGLNSYTSIYCDALSWIKGGYIDFIAPQIYWQFSTAVAKFDVLTRWWNAQCDGTNVDLLISHAAYRSAEWNSSNEILLQIEYARSEASYRGSIHYGYSAIKANDMNLQEQLKTAYENHIIYTDPVSDGTTVSVTYPPNGSSQNLDSTFILGKADPAYSVYMDGKPLSKTKQGYFSAYVTLKTGLNSFTFTQNGVDTIYKINNKIPSNQQTTWATYDKFMMTSPVPANDYMLEGGEIITVQVKAPSKSTVTATLGGVSIKLEQTTTPPNNADYMVASYSATYKLPSTTSAEIKDLGKIEYKAVRGNETAALTGASVSIKKASVVCAVEVTADDSELKVSSDSWYYDDYTPAVTGMRDYAVRLSDGYYKLRMGGYISQNNVKRIDSSVSAAAAITSAEITNENNTTKLIINSAENVPLNGYISEGEFIVTLYNVSSSIKEVKIGKNPLFSEARVGNGPQDNSFRIYLKLINISNFYGFEYSYGTGQVIATFRNPVSLAEGDKPLSGKTIILDAGHGGNETGASGPNAEFNEKIINLNVVLALRDILNNYGANVILTREDDSTVVINERLILLNKIEPDLCVSVHQNSMNLNTDITKIRGLVGLYFSDAGKLLTESVSAATAKALNRFERTPTTQRLAMVRNPKFPSTLVEVSFMTCVEEYNVMTSTSGIKKSAEGIAEGILNFYHAQEKFIIN